MRRDPKNKGFTLLELLTVIAIMAALSTMAVTSYFGAIRGMTRRSAIKHLANTLVLAKQRASMEGARMSVLIYNEMTGIQNDKEVYIPSYVIVRELGRVTKSTPERIYDEFTDLGAYFGFEDSITALKDDGEYSSTRLYNIDEAKWKEVYPKVYRDEKATRLYVSTFPQRNQKEDEEDNRTGYCDLQVFAFVVNQRANTHGGDAGAWRVGDRYGIEVSPPNSLPRGFSFEKIDEEEDQVMSVTFSPEGEVEYEGFTGSIQIQEQLGAKANWKSTGIRIENTGNISYDEKWR